MFKYEFPNSVYQNLVVEGVIFKLTGCTFNYRLRDNTFKTIVENNGIKYHFEYDNPQIMFETESDMVLFNKLLLEWYK